MSDTTKIMDLPENVTIHSSQQYQQNNGPPPPKQQNRPRATNTTTYAPIDSHPNPYGHPPPSIPTPSYSDSGQTNVISYPPTNSSYNTNDLRQLPQQHLPSRDIPITSVQYTHDETIQSNYIPPLPNDVRKRTTEYLKQYDEATERKIEGHTQMKQKQSRMDSLIEQGQIPFLVALLFFIFHMPIVSSYVFKHFAFLEIYNSDGNFNVYGLLLKSSIFGLVFYSLSKGIAFLSEF